jgi:solute carrier organic anion transporter family, member 5A
MRLCGPVLGYTLASYCLSLYIDPFATPTINNKDRRWMGAWWLGWIIFASIMAIFSIIVALFPRDLPRAFLRKKIEIEKQKRESLKIGKVEKIEQSEEKATLKDMLVSHKRLLKNKLFMLMHLSGVLHLFG